MSPDLREHYPGAADFRFHFQLAQELGMPVGELGERVTPREFEHWRSFFVAENERMAREEKS